MACIFTWLYFAFSQSRRRWHAEIRACRIDWGWGTSPQCGTARPSLSSGQMAMPSRTSSSEDKQDSLTSEAEMEKNPSSCVWCLARQNVEWCDWCMKGSDRNSWQWGAFSHWSEKSVSTETSRDLNWNEMVWVGLWGNCCYLLGILSALTQLCSAWGGGVD